MKRDLLKGLSDEQIAKVRKCKSSKDLLSLAKAEGIELSEEQLSAVNGGGCFSSNKCPKCGAKDYKKIETLEKIGTTIIYECKKCGHKWKI